MFYNVPYSVYITKVHKLYLVPLITTTSIPHISVFGVYADFTPPQEIQLHLLVINFFRSDVRKILMIGMLGLQYVN